VKSDLPPLSDAQLEIMEIVWELGHAGVADVRERLAERRSIARNTVQTQLTRLEDKGWLRHEEGETGFLYRATRPRRRALARMARSFVDRAFGGAADELVQSLLHGRSLSAAEAARIRELLDDHASGGGGAR
jgi:predicted transcriptional regulator